MQYILNSMHRLEVVKIKEEMKSSAFGAQIRKADEVYEIFRFLENKVQESLYVVCLNSKNRIIGYSELAKGRLNTCAVNTRELVQLALLSNACSVILLHNHPSGDCHPSSDDINITHKVKEALSLFGIVLLDHIIIGENDFSSLLERGYFGETDNRTDSKSKRK